MSLEHVFATAVADAADTSKLRPSNWGRVGQDHTVSPTHKFTGGALGSLIYRDTGAVDGKSWLADVAVGSVLVSGGVGAAPAWSDTPTLSRIGIGAAPKTTPLVYVNNSAGVNLWSKSGSTSNTRAHAIFENSVGQLRTAINAEGQFYTNGWVTISGAFTASANANGELTVFTTGASGLTTMLDVISDVAGPTIVAKANVNGWNFQGLDNSGNYTFSIEKTGALLWGTGSTKVSMDTGLARNAAGVLEVNNGTVGTFRDIIARAFQTSTALVALGGGAAPTLGTIGGSGPATAAQNTWLRMLDSTGAAFWVPVWK